MSAPKALASDMLGVLENHFCFVGVFGHALIKSQKVPGSLLKCLPSAQKPSNQKRIHPQGSSETNSAEHNHSMLQDRFPAEGSHFLDSKD